MKKYYGIVLIFAALISGIILSKCYSEDKEYFNIVKNMGYTDVEQTPSEVIDITIPEKFGRVYENYNNLLKTEGFDLEKYRGKTCKRYTYQIPSLNARANIFVYDDIVIGGDISGITIDGIMIPIKMKK